MNTPARPYPSTSEKLRPLGLLEKFSSMRHSLGFYKNLGLSAQYSCRASKVPLRGLIHRALKAVIAQHPALGTIPVDEDKPSAYFIRLPQINLLRCVRFVSRTRSLLAPGEVDNDELDALLEEEHNLDFKAHFGELPFWRAVVAYEEDNVTEFVLSFIVHHSICDGTSALIFHRSFLTALSSAGDLDNEATFSPFYAPATPLLPSLESALKLPLSTTYILKGLWSEYFAWRPRGLWTASPINTAVESYTRFRSFTVAKSTTEILVAAARDNRTSLTATVQAAVAASVFTHLPVEKYRLLTVDGAVSLRRFLPRDIIGEEAIGSYVSRYLEVHHRPKHGDEGSDLFSWDEARRIKGTIDGELGKKGADSVVSLLRYAGDLKRLFIRAIGNDRAESFEFSNLGVFGATKRDADWEIGRMVFSQSADVIGAAMEVSLVTGGDGCLSIGFSWLEKVVEKEWIVKVMQSLRSRLEHMS